MNPQGPFSAETRSGVPTAIRFWADTSSHRNCRGAVFLRLLLAIAFVVWTPSYSAAQQEDEAAQQEDEAAQQEDEAAQQEDEAAQQEDEAAQQDDEVTYRNLIAEAVNEYKRGNWEETRSLFQKAHELKPSARTLRGMGMASFEARRYVEALLALQESLFETRKPLTERQRSEVESLLERAKLFVGSFALRMQPDAATISVDGRQAVVQEGRLLLNPGQREIVAKAQGYETLIRRVAVDGGSSRTLELILRPLLEKTAKLPKQEEEEAVVVSKPKSGPKPSVDPAASEQSDELLPWIVLGTSGAVAVTGAVMLTLTLKDKSAVANADRGVKLEEIEAAHDRVPVFSTLGSVLLSVGVAGAAVGIVLLVAGDSSEGEQQTLTVMPNGILMRGSL